MNYQDINLLKVVQYCIEEHKKKKCLGCSFKEECKMLREIPKTYNLIPFKWAGYHLHQVEEFIKNEKEENKEVPTEVTNP